MSIDLLDVFTWPTKFSCILIVDDAILPVNYTLTVSMLPINKAGISGIGLTKIKEFIAKFIQNSVIIDQNNTFLTQLSLLDTTIVQLPSAPSDYFFANTLYRKLTAVAQDYFIIQQITIDSTVGDHVKYQVSKSCTTYKNILDKEGWWSRDDVSTNNTQHFPQWKDLNIHDTPKFSAKVVRGGQGEVKSI
jgi:hypothetical protein